MKPSSKQACCQVLGCTADLTKCSSYCLAKRICQTHLRAEALTLPGHGPDLNYRFCQQCGRLHLMAEFDGNKRSCRMKLTQRRAARQAMRVGALPDAPFAVAATTAPTTDSPRQPKQWPAAHGPVGGGHASAAAAPQLLAWQRQAAAAAWLQEQQHSAHAASAPGSAAQQRCEHASTHDGPPHPPQHASCNAVLLPAGTSDGAFCTDLLQLLDESDGSYGSGWTSCNNDGSSGGLLPWASSTALCAAHAEGAAAGCGEPAPTTAAAADGLGGGVTVAIRPEAAGKAPPPALQTHHTCGSGLDFPVSPVFVDALPLPSPAGASALGMLW